MKGVAEGVFLCLGICLGGEGAALCPAADLRSPSLLSSLAGSPAGNPSMPETNPTRTGRRHVVQGGPAAPNESRVVGRILQLEALDPSGPNILPPQALRRIRLRLLRIEDTPGTVNRLSGQEGAVLELYSKEPLDQGWVGKDIAGVVRFRRDERGGRYWLQNVRRNSQGTNP